MQCNAQEILQVRLVECEIMLIDLAKTQGQNDPYPTEGHCSHLLWLPYCSTCLFYSSVRNSSLARGFVQICSAVQCLVQVGNLSPVDIVF